MCSEENSLVAFPAVHPLGGPEALAVGRPVVEAGVQVQGEQQVARGSQDPVRGARPVRTPASGFADPPCPGLPAPRATP